MIIHIDYTFLVNITLNNIIKLFIIAKIQNNCFKKINQMVKTKVCKSIYNIALKVIVNSKFSFTIKMMLHYNKLIVIFIIYSTRIKYILIHKNH